jgi:cupin fold WbuC family metalloprotein
MEDTQIPELTRHEIDDFLSRAASSPRRRAPKILHEPGAVLNQVFNFMLHDSYMQPHLHPGVEKIEKISLVEGKIAVLMFTDEGGVRDVVVLERGHVEYVEIPAFTWHTYVMLSDGAVTYETMMGRYEPGTWKGFAAWAPAEATPECVPYLAALKAEAARRAG